MPPQRGGARTRRPAGLLRSEEHTSELQSPCNLVCRIIISKEHTSELQSPCNLVCRLLLEKKKNSSSSRVNTCFSKFRVIRLYLRTRSLTGHLSTQYEDTSE